MEPNCSAGSREAPAALSSPETSPAFLTHGVRTREAALRPNPKRKRGHYTSLACYECKKRKTKCNGTHPCNQCAKSGKKCSFPPSALRHHRSAVGGGQTREILQRLSTIEDRIRTSSVHPQPPISHPRARPASDAIIQETSFESPQPTQRTVKPVQEALKPFIDSPAPRQVPPEGNAAAVTSPSLASSLSAACSKDPEAGTTASVYTPATTHYKYNINLAQQSLAARGVCHLDANDGGCTPFAVDSSRLASPTPRAVAQNGSHHDAVWLVDRREAQRLCDVYEEEINISHPFLDMPTIRGNVGRLYDSMDVLRGHGCAGVALHDTTVLGQDDLSIVKLVFATALITESGGPERLASALFEDVKASVWNKIWGDVSISSIIIFFLLAMWQFLADNDTITWRLTGIVARWCIEIGLNQNAFLRQLPGTDHDRRMAIRLFWCVHALDRRWSFGNGLPFIIQDSDIDKNYPEPDDQVPYLKAMVNFSHIMSAVWYAAYSSPIDRSDRRGRDEASYLEFRINKWWEELPEEFQLGSNDGDDDQYSRGMKRLRILLYLRRCQLKILLHQCVLHSPALIQQHTQTADSVVQLAKDVIWKLDNLHHSTDIYSTQHMCFNYFLVLSLGVILLAVTHAPERYAGSVQAEFHAALDLVESLSAASYVSRRLWRFLHSLRPLGQSLNVDAGGSAQTTAQHQFGSSSALSQPQGLADPDIGMGLFQFTEDALYPFQPSDELVGTSQLMDSVRSIFDNMERDWLATDGAQV